METKIVARKSALMLGAIMLGQVAAPPQRAGAAPEIVGREPMAKAPVVRAGVNRIVMPYEENVLDLMGARVFEWNGAAKRFDVVYDSSWQPASNGGWDLKITSLKPYGPANAVLTVPNTRMVGKYKVVVKQPNAGESWRFNFDIGNVVRRK